MGLLDVISDFADEHRRRKEMKEEAKKYRREAERFLKKAESLYEGKYQRLKSNAWRIADDVGDLIKKHINYKAGLLEELGGEINSSIENFKRFNIDSRVVKNIDIGSGSFSVPSIAQADSFNSYSCIGGGFSLPGLCLSALSDPEEDRDEAFEQRCKAQEYLWQVEEAIRDMELTKERLKSTRQYIRDEREELDQLMGKVRKIVSQLGDAMQKQSYTEREAKYVKGICNIAEMIKKTLEVQIANDDGTISANYQEYSGRIRQINRAIPDAPVLKESSNDNWLSDIIVC